ncbi:glutathione S-transferase family protein [Phenylobacterium sp. J367]|uniref:glutathione S-transferase family protein n=1 Tax=Phenylobacterium sp. J367 TaxID=2898435 RepID=UPI0021510FD7|nr:glutathione S-transferase family protein [Phenylobacterium sp. J367]MCR5879901.1 glutathione S-transferase family protein [Phenylobacterium sp. J367]
MPLILHEHPLSSYCWKAKIALYEMDLPFEARLLELYDEAKRNAHYARWPLGKMPVLEDTGRDAVVAETSVIVEYLQAFHAPSAGMIPADLEAALRVRLLDRVFDSYVMEPMSRVVAENFRGGDDPVGVAQADALLARAYDYLERELAGRTWAAGDTFTLADCAAAPSLFYADKVLPFRASHPTLGAYLDRLEARPSFARVLREAEPVFHMFPGRKAA